MISFDRPFALFYCFALIPALLYTFFSFRRLSARFGLLYGGRPDMENCSKKLRRKFALRSVCWGTAALCLIVAYAGPYWGSEPIAVQKNGNAVSFVFDVSYSMLAADMPPLTRTEKNSTRLAYAGSYASELLNRFQTESVSAVLAKGSGVLAVPLTEDYAVIHTLLKALSPQLLSSAGSDPGQGILTAVRSFARQSAAESFIVLFTDGDETVHSLEAALTEAVNYGATVIIIGFGGVNEIEITAGDGITRVTTALRENKMRSLAQNIHSKSQKRPAVGARKPKMLYINALERASALTVLNMINTGRVSVDSKSELRYSSRPIPRFALFLAVGCFLFIAGFICGEFTFRLSKTPAVLIVLCLFVFTSCSPGLALRFDMLSGVFAWSRNDYQNAVASFLRVKELAAAESDAVSAQYATYALGTTYLAQNELKASEERLLSITDDAPPNVASAVWYDRGIGAYREGEYARAAEYFKNSLRIDSMNSDAKINLELSLSRASALPQPVEQNLQGAQDSQDDKTMQESLFSVIREKEQTQWQNRQSSTPESGSADY